MVKGRLHPNSWTLSELFLALYLAAALAGAVLFNIPGADDGDGVLFAILLVAAMVATAGLGVMGWMLGLWRRWRARSSGGGEKSAGGIRRIVGSAEWLFIGVMLTFFGAALRPGTPGDLPVVEVATRTAVWVGAGMLAVVMGAMAVDGWRRERKG